MNKFAIFLGDTLDKVHDKACTIHDAIQEITGYVERHSSAPCSCWMHTEQVCDICQGVVPINSEPCYQCRKQHEYRDIDHVPPCDCKCHARNTGDNEPAQFYTKQEIDARMAAIYDIIALPNVGLEKGEFIEWETVEKKILHLKSFIPSSPK